MRDNPKQLPLFLPTDIGETVENETIPNLGSLPNKISPENRPFHDWYRFVLSYPPHLVSHYLQEFGLRKSDTILDPFCGTGTSLVEAKLRGVRSMGIEANPFAHFASSVKVNWEIDPRQLMAAAEVISKRCLEIYEAQNIDDLRLTHSSSPAQEYRTLEADEMKLLLQDSISPLPLHKVLVLRDCIYTCENEPYYPHLLLALAKAVVFTISNLNFGPEVGLGKRKRDVHVVGSWLGEVKKIARDVETVSGESFPVSTVHLADARQVEDIIPPATISAVITSPPYPNEKDYTRTTRLESVLLGFIKNKDDLQRLKRNLVRSNSRGVYKGDDDNQWVQGHREIQELAEEIERRRIELGKTSGFERMYGRVTKLYFGGMARHLAELRYVLRPGAQLAYVVGDQASYLQVMIRTGKLLAEIAQAMNYEVVRIELFRKRFATATRQELREEVVILRWKG